MTPPLVGEVSVSSGTREHQLARTTLSGWLSPNFVQLCECSCYKVTVLLYSYYVPCYLLAVVVRVVLGGKEL